MVNITPIAFVGVKPISSSYVTVSIEFDFDATETLDVACANVTQELLKLVFRTLLTIIFYLTFVYFYIIIYLSKEKEYSNMKEQIKSRILVEMQSVLNREQLQELKLCLDRNLYNVVIESECQSELV